MSYILRNVRPADIQNWVKTNSPASLKATAAESWRAYLIASGAVGGTLRDLEMSFLASLARTAGTLHDRWQQELSGTSGGKGSEKARNRYK